MLVFRKGSHRSRVCVCVHRHLFLYIPLCLESIRTVCIFIMNASVPPIYGQSATVGGLLTFHCFHRFRKFLRHLFIFTRTSALNLCYYVLLRVCVCVCVFFLYRAA